MLQLLTFKMKFSLIKICVRIEWILIALVLVLMVGLRQEQERHSRWYTKVLHSLQERESKETQIVSDFLQNNGLLPLSVEPSPNTANQTKTEMSAQDFYKRCFSRPLLKQTSQKTTGHPHFHGYIIENSGLCSAQKRVDVLVYINSAVKNRERRQAIRQSWASHNAFSLISLRLVFILGQTSSTREQLEVFTEHASSGDIVQAKFKDSFQNLTYKAVTFMTWATTHCAQAQYIVKVDDDMFVDMFRVIVDLLPQMMDKNYAMACYYSKGKPIVRDPKKLWYVEDTLLVGQTRLPNFCPGFFTVMTGNIIPELYNASLSVKDFISIDDVYMTGLSLKNPEKVTIVDIRNKIYPHQRPNPDQEMKEKGHFEYIAFGLNNEAKQSSLWNLRLNNLSPLEEKFSSYKNIFKVYGNQSVVIKN